MNNNPVIVTFTRPNLPVTSKKFTMNYRGDTTNCLMPTALAMAIKQVLGTPSVIPRLPSLTQLFLKKWVDHLKDL